METIVLFAGILAFAIAGGVFVLCIAFLLSVMKRMKEISENTERIARVLERQDLRESHQYQTNYKNQ